MDVDTKVLLDCSKFEFELINSGEFKTNKHQDNNEMKENVEVSSINFYEYTIKLK